MRAQPVAEHACSLAMPQGRGAHLHSYKLLPSTLPTAGKCPVAHGGGGGAGGEAKQCPFKQGDDTFLLSMPNRGDRDEPHAVLRGPPALGEEKFFASSELN